MPDPFQVNMGPEAGWILQVAREIIPECDAELCAGLVEAEKGVAAVATDIAWCHHSPFAW